MNGHTQGVWKLPRAPLWRTTSQMQRAWKVVRLLFRGIVSRAGVSRVTWKVVAISSQNRPWCRHARRRLPRARYVRSRRSKICEVNLKPMVPSGQKDSRVCIHLAYQNKIIEAGGKYGFSSRAAVGGLTIERPNPAHEEPLSGCRCVYITSNAQRVSQASVRFIAPGTLEQIRHSEYISDRKVLAL